MDPGLTIVLLGNSGVGKSASGNTILGRTAFVSKKSFRPVTTAISIHTESVFGKRISVVDTPGILGSDETEIQNRCQELRGSSCPLLFLVVVKIDRFTNEQRDAVKAAIRVIGEDFDSCYLLFTGGDNLDAMQLEDFIREDPTGPLGPLVDRFQGRLHVFNNKNGGQEQVRTLLEKTGHLEKALSPREDMRIVLLGLPGDGKSASGNTILGSDRFDSRCDFDAVTTMTVSKSAMVETRRVTVVDTPGFTQKVLSPRKLFDEIMKSIEDAQPGPHAFVIVVKLGRITKAEMKLMRILPILLGENALRYAVVLFTHGDGLQGQSVDHLIRRNKSVFGLVSKCAGQFCVFDNTQKGNRVQVRNLLAQIDQMVASNGGVHFTSETFQRFYYKARLDIFWDQVREVFIRAVRVMDQCRQGSSTTSDEEDDRTCLLENENPEYFQQNMF